MFCLRFSPGAGKGKMVTEITKPVAYLSGSFGENRGVFPIGKIPEKKKGRKFEISVVFLARGLGQMRGADIKVSFT